MVTQADLPVGAGVVYDPGHGGRREDGVVTKHSAAYPSIVFVRYAGQHPAADGKATQITDLTLLNPPTTQENP